MVRPGGVNPDSDWPLATGPRPFRPNASAPEGHPYPEIRHQSARPQASCWEAVFPVKSDLLVRIKDAEAEAQSRQAQAEAEAKAIVADARRQAEAMLAEGRAQADFAAQSRLEQARKAAGEEAKKAVAAGEKQAAALRKRFESAATGAAPRVVKLFEDRLA